MAITPINGSDTFPTTANAFYSAVETLAVQNIRAIKNTNKIENGFYDYEIDGNGNIIEEAVIKMATRQAFTNTGAPDLSPVDPTLHIRYFNNFTANQFETTLRKDDIRKIIADKNATPESVASGILESLTEGEGNYDYEQMRDVIKNVSVGVDASSELFNNKVPKNMKGVLYALRQMYNVIKATNQLTGMTFKQSCPPEDVRVAVSEDILNLVDVTELANVFNLSKEQLFGQLVVIPHDANYTETRVCVYDRKALGRATRVYDYSQDVIGKGRYTNHYLTTERAYFYNPLFKFLYLDISQATTKALGDVLEAVAE